MNDNETKQDAGMDMTDMPDTSALAVTPSGALNLFDWQTLKAAYKLASIMATAKGFVPAAFEGKPGPCMGALCIAHTWAMNPFLVMAGMATVHDKLVLEGKLVQAAVETSSLMVGRLTFKFYGDWKRIQGKFKLVESQKARDESGQPKRYPVAAWRVEDEQGLGVTVSGMLKGESEPATLDVDLLSCHPRNSTIWATDPQQQIIYTATRRWARRHTPQIMLGVYTRDELEEGAVIDVTPRASEQTQEPADDLAAKLAEARAKRAAANSTPDRKRDDTPSFTLSAEPDADPSGHDALIAAIGMPADVILEYFAAQPASSAWHVARGDTLDALAADRRHAIRANPTKYGDEIGAWFERQEADAEAQESTNG